VTFPKGFDHTPYLPEPTRVPQLIVVIDFTDAIDSFYEGSSGMTSPCEGSFQEFLMCLQPSDLVEMALHALEATITRGSYSTGVGYHDLAKIDRHPEARRSLYAGSIGESFDQYYKPKISATEQYHLDCLEGALTDAIQERAGDASRQAIKPMDDVILWRCLYACVLVIAKTVAEAGRMKGISENGLVSYHFSEARPYGQNTNAFILTLTGP
jgi:hypothetical protein